MKKTICFFIILAQSFLFLVYAEEQNAGQPDQAQPAAASATPAARSDKGIKKIEAVPAPEAQKKEVKTQAAPQEVVMPVVPEEEVKEPAVTEEGPYHASQEAQGTVVLRERVSDQNPLRKVARGAVNTTLGWVEIPRQMIKENKAKGDIAGVFWGPLKGFAFFVGRTAVGLYEVTTFLIPPYKPVVTPEFILSDEDND
jgi:putative exosortase-associated protein (TIGR04073 family)